ncbi:type VI secretion system baseplate subunit TssE [Thaumasiovibrio subtropicus]|uniref:type VI secretion system baseplate subunit TssE n=1 Tax=Thaumasiovibrio subtropicus TaxID=1891207 RepID=UPI00131B1EA4|nr:type VI secretion system baseplate subunit TssE [Thaumasiovibrio subtropicus]
MSDKVAHISFLDKLIDLSPENSLDRHEYRQPSISLANLRRDIENLLNARIGWNQWQSQFEEIDVSILNYGLPDFSSMPFSSQSGKNHLCSIVEETLGRFEPRLFDVEVSVKEGEDEVDRTLRLRIQAVVVQSGVSEEIVFDSEVEPVNLGFKVSEGGR